MYTCLCVCSDLSLGNSCSGVELIAEWVFFLGGGGLPIAPQPPTPTILSHSLLYYRAPSKWQSAFVQPLKSLSHSFPTHSPTTKEPSCCGADWGKGIDKTVVGKDLSLCQVVHARDYQKDCIFLFRALWPCLFVYSCAREIHATVSQFWKGKRYDLLPHMASWPCFGPCYFWIDRI